MEDFSLAPIGDSEIVSEVRILAIDDDADFREFLKVFLEQSDCRWAITSNMDDFRRAYQELDHTVILTDMSMPEVDGFEVMAWLREQGYTCRLVLVSGSNHIYTDAAAKLGSARGLADLITLQKPMHLTDLRTALGIS